MWCKYKVNKSVWNNLVVWKPTRRQHSHKMNAFPTLDIILWNLVSVCAARKKLFLQWLLKENKNDGSRFFLPHLKLRPWNWSNGMSLFPALVLYTHVLGQDKYRIFVQHLINSGENMRRILERKKKEKEKRFSRSRLNVFRAMEMKCTDLLASISGIAMATHSICRLKKIVTYCNLNAAHQSPSQTDFWRTSWPVIECKWQINE